MSWITVIWSMVASACLTLGLVHGLAWWGRRVAWPNPQHRPENRGCIVTDLRMPDMSGLELQSALARSDNPLPIVFLTGHGDIPTSVHTIERGAEDFLTKPVRKEELFAAVERALAQDATTFEHKAHQRELRLQFEMLTPGERQVLRHVLAGKLNKEIAADLGAPESTIKAHRASIMNKLHVQPPAELGRITQELGSALRNV
ncbi:MAG: response regulator transcription factor [Steroidobacteraceae bacterium]